MKSCSAMLAGSGSPRGPFRERTLSRRTQISWQKVFIIAFSRARLFVFHGPRNDYATRRSPVPPSNRPDVCLRIPSMLHQHLIDLRQVAFNPPAPRSKATRGFPAPPMAWSTLESTRNVQLGAWYSANAIAACARSPRCATRARGSGDPGCTPSVWRHLAELRPSLVNTSHCINDYFVLFWSQKGTKKIQATWLRKAPPIPGEQRSR